MLTGGRFVYDVCKEFVTYAVDCVRFPVSGTVGARMPVSDWPVWEA